MIEEDDVDERRVARAEHFVLIEVRVEDTAGLGVDAAILEQRVRDAMDDAAVELARSPAKAGLASSAMRRERYRMLRNYARPVREELDCAAMRVLVCCLVLVACSKSERLESNFASVKLGEQITSTKDGAPYSGKLIARDREITAVAKVVLGGHLHADEIDATGLVLVLPVASGVPDGQAAVYADLNAPKLNAEVARRSASELAIGRAAGGTIKIAEATFKAGKLDGVATAYEPSSKGKTKLGEAHFKNHVLHGPVIELYPGTTQKKRERQFENGIQIRVGKDFYPDGKIERETPYVAGQVHGEIKEYYANGKPRARMTYENGKPVGTHERWYPTGQLSAKRTFGDDTIAEERWYSNGKPATEPPDGTIEEFHANGAVHVRGTFKNGIKQGPYEELYADGKKWKTATYVDDKEHGPYREWWKNGKPALEATYVNGVLDGDFKRWYANGKPWETARYANGKLVGPYRKWWKNGKLAHEYAYKDGKLDGDYKLFYDNGAKWAAGKHVDGKPQGALQRWFRDGKLGYVMNHENGRPHGEYKRWWPNGKPRLEAHHERGQLHGEFKNWLEDGTVYELATYERGVKVQTTRPPKQEPAP